MQVVNWGILGAASFARRHMGPAIHAARGARLAALATSDAVRAEPFRDFCPDLIVYSDYEALLADPAIDAVYIPLPNHLHVPWALKALAAGKHVLCEKPLAMTLGEVDALIAARDGSGLLAAEAFMIVHHPQWIQVRDWIAAGEIGRVEHADAHFSYDNRADPGNIRNKPEMGGGGIRDIGVYTYSSVRYATGAEPVVLRSRIRRENGVDVWAEVAGTMAGPGGAFTYTGRTSMRLYPRQEVVIQGEGGMIRVPVPFNAGVMGEARLELFRQGQPDLIGRFPAVNQYVLQVEAFGQSLRAAAPYPWPLEQARGTQAMIEMALAGEV